LPTTNYNPTTFPPDSNDRATFELQPSRYKGCTNDVVLTRGSFVKDEVMLHVRGKYKTVPDDMNQMTYRVTKAVSAFGQRIWLQGDPDSMANLINDPTVGDPLAAGVVPNVYLHEDPLSIGGLGHLTIRANSDLVSTSLCPVLLWLRYNGCFWGRNGEQDSFSCWRKTCLQPDDECMVQCPRAGCQMWAHHGCVDFDEGEDLESIVCDSCWASHQKLSNNLARLRTVAHKKRVRKGTDQVQVPGNKGKNGNRGSKEVKEEEEDAEDHEDDEDDEDGADGEGSDDNEEEETGETVKTGTTGKTGDTGETLLKKRNRPSIPTSTSINSKQQKQNN
jgi:hypothetical protein